MRCMRIFILAILTFSSNSFSYFINESNSSKKTSWSRDQISLDVLPNNNSISGINTLSIVRESIRKWNSHSSTNILMREVSVLNSNNNSLSFSNSSSEFYNDNGIAAITRIVYGESSGEIISAKIFVNDNKSWNASKGSDNYLGDVITHELGHFFGLGHSQVKDATMLYYLARGQYELDTDDKSGIHHLYPKEVKNSISGRVIGGNDLIGVLGAHVKAISNDTGKVFASAFTNEDGDFQIAGLDEDSYYYLYVEPAKELSTLSSTYSQARSDFCLGGRDYRGAFFQSCFPSDEGRPYAVYSGGKGRNIQIGKISVRCNYDLPVDYMIKKGGGVNELELFKGGFLGLAQTGHFSFSEVSSNASDYYSLDLSEYDFSDGTYKLDIKTLSQNLYSSVVLSLDGTSDLGGFSASFSFNSDNVPMLDLSSELSLDSANPNNNIFNFRITPELIQTNPSLDSTLAFPALDSFADDMNIYLLMIKVKKLQSNGLYKIVNLNDKITYFDNSACPDAKNTFTVTSEVASSISTESISRDRKNGLDAIACGTVGREGPPNGPMSSLLIGFCFVMVIKLKRSAKSS